MNIRVCIRFIAAAVPLFLALSARAEHFDIDLTIEGASDRQEAHSDDYPPFAGREKRPVFHGKKGETLQLQMLVTSAHPHDVLKRVGIRFYLVSVSGGPLKSTPPADAPAVLNGTFTMDFKVKGKFGYKQKFVIPEAGSYLLRVESSNGTADHEHFSAIDVDIQ